MADDDFNLEDDPLLDELFDEEDHSLADDTADDEEPFNFEEEFERLREKSARTSVVYDDLDVDADEDVSEGGFFSQITPRQRLVLALLALLDVIVIAIGVLVVLGII